VAGAKAAASIKDAKEWRSSRPAQFSIPEDNLIAAVRDLIARQED
jgi:histidyl-tRNA synthetase